MKGKGMFRSTGPARQDADEYQEKSTYFKDWRRLVFRQPVVFILAALAFAGIAVTTVDLTDYYFSSENFCATTCHVMTSTVYKEMQQSKHWTTPTGVRPKCADCHVSGRLTFAMVDHAIGTTELLTWLRHDFTKPGSFEPFRPAAADRARFQFLNSDSANCRRCHVMEAIKPARKRGEKQHKEALKDGTTCIVCHYNLVHKAVDPSPAFLKAIGEAK